MGPRGTCFFLQGTFYPNHWLAKKPFHFRIFCVINWFFPPFHSLLRFKAVIEMVRPDKMDPAVNIKGVDYVEVPPNSSRKYKLSFFSYKEGQTQIKVVFKNEATGEYQVRSGR